MPFSEKGHLRRPSRGQPGLPKGAALQGRCNGRPRPRHGSRGPWARCDPMARPIVGAARARPSSSRSSSRKVRPSGYRSQRCRGERQLDEECRTNSLARFDPDAASHASDEFPADVEAEAGAADSPGHVRVEAVELLEDPLLLGLRNTDALVADRYAKVSSTLLEPDLDTAGARRILDRVGHEVRDHLPELVGVRGDCSERGGRHELERELLRSVRARGLDHRACDVRDVDLLARENESAGLDLAREQDVVRRDAPAARTGPR